IGPSIPWCPPRWPPSWRRSRRRSRPANSRSSPPRKTRAAASEPVPIVTSVHGATMLRMQRISKSFGSVHANRSIDLQVAPGRIVGLLGENGSGKTSLMNVLFGIVAPDAGTIVFKDRPLVGHSPREAIAAGIGMIHQHFMLVPAMTVTENVMLGWKATGRWLRPSAVAAQIRA